MRLFFLRHGQAEYQRDDFSRALTVAGCAEVQACGFAAAKYVQSVVQVAVSPLMRAQQTCQLFCEAAGISPAVETADWLQPESSPREVVAQLLLAEEDVLLVSHQPLANALLNYLNDSAQPLAFVDTGTLVVLEGATVAHAAMQPVLRVDRNGVSRLN